MMKSSRRGFLAGATALPLAGAASAQAAAAARIAADLSTYIGFGNKRSGGPGDTPSGHWLAAELASAGSAVDNLPTRVPWFAGGDGELATGDARAPWRPEDGR